MSLRINTPLNPQELRIKAAHAEQSYNEFMHLFTQWMQNIEEGMLSVLEVLDLSSNPKTKELVAVVGEQLKVIVNTYGSKCESGQVKEEDIEITKKVFEGLINELMSTSYTYKQ
ncbi:hypothetical protein ACOME3_010671 [Neoechinorhynchus agilis]